MKLTNPIHGLYFTTTTAQEPFVHLVITLGAFHWIVTGLTYSLSAMGFYMLFDLFDDSTYATTRLAVLVSLAALPVVFDLIGYLSPDVIITLNYEPIGVALFAVGVLYVADGSFLAVQIFGREQLLDELEEAIVLLDSDGVIRDVNDTARWLFPALTEGVGCAATTVIPEITNHLPVDDPRVITVEEGDAARYYLLSAPELTVGRTTIGRALVLTDVTEVERQRREVERQRDQLDDFAAAITHELRNTVNILQGHLQQVETGLTPDTDPRTVESITTAVETTDRMTDIVGDLATLAQFGHRPKETTAIDVASVAREAWATLGVETAELTVSAEPTIEADPARLERLFVNLFEFMVQNGATEIELGYSNGTIVVTDDGRPLTAGNVERAFAYGEAVPDAEVGMLLPVVRTLADTHGWETTIDPEYQAGVRFQIVQ